MSIVKDLIGIGFSEKDLLATRRSENTCLEDFPSISVAQLRAAGAFDGADSDVWPVELSARILGERIIVFVSAFQDYVWINSSRSHLKRDQEFPFVKRRYGVAERILLICPPTGVEVNRLYLINGEFVPRHVYRFPYRSQLTSYSDRVSERRETIIAQLKGSPSRRPPRGKRRLELMMRLSVAMNWKGRDDEGDVMLEAYVEQRRQRRGRRARRIEQELARRRRQTSVTDTAIECCRSGKTYVSNAIALERLDVGWEECVEQHIHAQWRFPRGDWPGLLLPRAALEDYPVIDIRVLLRRGLIREGQFSAWAMCWDPASFPSGAVYVGADLRNGNLPHLRLASATGQAPTRQIIGLLGPTSRDRSRWQFKDPGTFKACEVVALRNGLFARPQSQHLVHASQIRGRGRVSCATTKRGKADKKERRRAAEQKRLRDARDRLARRGAQALAEARRGTSATDKAIECCASGEYEVSQDVALDWVEHGCGAALEQYRDHLWDRPPGDWPGLSLARAVLEDHPVIDIRVLLRRGLIRNGEITAWAMGWDLSDLAFGFAFVAADLRNDNVPHLRVVFPGEKGDTVQIIGLLGPRSRDRSRWSFRDPASLRACEVLVLRNGLFASSQSQRLAYASQVRSRSRGKSVRAQIKRTASRRKQD